MLNQLVMVGRLTKNIENGIITIAIPRNYKNENGEYDTDFINCRINGNIATNTTEYCQKGDIVGVKGSVHSENGEMYIQTEKITFLSSKHQDNNEEE